MSNIFNGGDSARDDLRYEEILASLFHKPFDFLGLAALAAQNWQKHEPSLRGTRLLASEALVMAVGWLEGDAPGMWAATVGRPWPSEAFPAWLLLLDEGRVRQAKRIPEMSIGTCYLAELELVGGHVGTFVVVVDHEQHDAVVYAICTDVALSDVELVLCRVLRTSPSTNLPMRPGHVKVVLRHAITRSVQHATTVDTEHNQWPTILPVLELAIEVFHWPH